VFGFHGFSRGKGVGRYAFLSMKRPSEKKSKVRPSLDDVERISWGQAAKKRGVGSRAVPHRLNAAERKEWELAKKRGFVLLRGSGWRKERGDSPLANIYRNLCDAKAIPCISVARGLGIDGEDVVTVDFSPLRTLAYDDSKQACLEEARGSHYTSLKALTDNTVEALGWDITEELVGTEVIWRLPVYSVIATFTSRAESRRYAVAVAHAIAGGPVPEMKDGDDDATELKVGGDPGAEAGTDECADADTSASVRALVDKRA